LSDENQMGAGLKTAQGSVDGRRSHAGLIIDIALRQRGRHESRLHQNDFHVEIVSIK